MTRLLGVLDEASMQNLVDFPKVFARMQVTTFRVSAQLIQSLFQQHYSKDKRS